MDLSKSHPKPHPTRAVFKKHRISISTVSRFLDLSYHHCANILNGLVRCTPENDEKLCQLAKEVQKSGRD